MKKIVVIGSGPAGLSAALTLKEMGADVQVLERAPTSGGRVRSVREDGFVIDRGASFLMASYRRTLELVKKLGLSAELYRVDVPARYDVLRNNDHVRVNYGSILGPLLFGAVPLSQRLRMGRLALLALKLRGPRRMDFLSTRGLEKLDDESIASFVTRKVGRDVLEALLEPMLTTYCGWTPEQTSKAYLGLMSRVGRLKLYAFRDGIGQLTEAMAEGIPVDCGVTVRDVHQSADGVEVSLSDHMGAQHALSADAAIVAIPGSRVLGLWRSPPEPERRFLEQVSYAPAVLTHLCANKDWGYRGIHGFFFPRESERKTTGVALEHVRYRGRAPEGSSVLYTGPRLSTYPELFDASDRAVVELCTEDLEAEFPGLGSATVKTFVFRWANAIPNVPPGWFRTLRDYLDERNTGQIALAGDYIGGPSIEGAISSGVDAAKRVRRALS